MKLSLIPDLSDWCANCAQKPAVIREAMRRHPGESIVWLDADARLRHPPDLFDTLDCDFAAHWRYGVELLSGTLYFGPTEGAGALVEAWAKAQATEPGVWDQKVLQRLIDGNAVPGLRVVQLPAEYTAIFDGRMCSDPVIEHLQASRRLAKAF